MAYMQYYICMSALHSQQANKAPFSVSYTLTRTVSLDNSLFGVIICFHKHDVAILFSLSTSVGSAHG